MDDETTIHRRLTGDDMVWLYTILVSVELDPRSEEQIRLHARTIANKLAEGTKWMPIVENARVSIKKYFTRTKKEKGDEE